MRILVVYYSQTGNTKKMAEIVAQAAKSKETNVDLKEVGEVKAKDLLDYDGIIIGSPTYYGGMAWQIKQLIDESVELHGDLQGKIGGAFSSSANIGGGNETTILNILQTMLIHGMIVQGTSSGDHYGPVAIDSPDDRAAKQCKQLGQRVASLVRQLKKR
ncbi:MAG: flavodoxin family protein [Candidatus Omnitrophica bacterium]|nr:flavodoxin family protein [Candidatus Omnitrophota bacterium]